MSVVIEPLSREQFIQRADGLIKKRLTPVAQKIRDEISAKYFTITSPWFIFLAFFFSLFLVGLPVLIWAIYSRLKISEEFEKRFEEPVLEIYADVIRECGLAVVNNSFTRDFNKSVNKYVKLFTTGYSLDGWSKLYHYQLDDGSGIDMSTVTYMTGNNYISSRYRADEIGYNKKKTLGLISITFNKEFEKNNSYLYSLFHRYHSNTNKIKLENNEFNHKIGIWSNDELKARMTATPYAMETYLKHYKQNIKNNWLLFARDDHHIDIAFTPTNDGLLYFDCPLTNDVERLVNSGYQDIINDLYEIYCLLALTKISAYI